MKNFFIDVVRNTGKEEVILVQAKNEKKALAEAKKIEYVEKVLGVSKARA